jgi:hypothetical protein
MKMLGKWGIQGVSERIGQLIDWYSVEAAAKNSYYVKGIP